MPVFLLGIGSNIQPESNVPKAHLALANLGQVLNTSQVVNTPADGPYFSGTFANQLVLLQADKEATELKQALLSIEEQMGREPKCPERKYRDRTIDLDILGQAETEQGCLLLRPEESYYLNLLESWKADSKDGFQPDNGLIVER
jgi:2-amino-4-hydroxy-6-hydroxymethyldihydropteridine diphosphokinase